jgi:N-methylhydantoinase B
MATEEHTGSNVWQDFVTGYEPTDDLDIHPDLSLHATSEQPDPATYEVLRHRLYTINEEHGITLENVSGSPVAAFAQDFNPTLMAEDGEVVFQGPYVQFFSPIAEIQAKWILENRSDNPGIEPGDVFLSNDPWVGSTHQSDVFFVAPVFHGGELFCWVANALHQYDIGGTNAGSNCPGAADVFDEPVPIPPIKIAEGGDVREDLRQMYLRHTRLPQLVGLDFNAQVAGITRTRKRIKDVLKEYSPALVKGVMKEVVSDAETKFLEKLETIPEGKWRGRSYVDGTSMDDDSFHRFDVQITKRDDRLVFSDEGTAPNSGSLNMTFAGFKTAISSVINPLMMHDTLWATGGAFRHIDVDITTGNLSRAKWPSGISNGHIGVQYAIPTISSAVVRMLAASPELREDIIAGPQSGIGAIAHAGIDQWGEQYGTMNLDSMAPGGVGASPHKDGIDTSGLYYAPKAPAPNVEHNEQDYPLLYLYKSEAVDSGGAGRNRGGAGLYYCWKPHKTDLVQSSFVSAGSAAPLSTGLSGHPGGTVVFRSMSDSDVADRFDSRSIPTDLTELDGDLETQHGKTEGIQQPDDVWEIRNAGSPGYGDPLERPPQQVADDVDRGLVSTEAATDVYGVVLDADDSGVIVDEDATVQRREAIRENRLENGYLPAQEE